MQIVYDELTKSVTGIFRPRNNHFFENVSKIKLTLNQNVLREGEKKKTTLDVSTCTYTESQLTVHHEIFPICF